MTTGTVKLELSYDTDHPQYIVPVSKNELELLIELVHELAKTAQKTDAETGNRDFESIDRLEQELKNVLDTVGPLGETILPSYQELLDWLQEKGQKTEQDLFVYWANMDYDAIHDMTRKEVVEMLLDEGMPKYDRSHIMPLWEEMDDDTRSNYKEWMIQFWANN